MGIRGVSGKPEQRGASAGARSEERKGKTEVCKGHCGEIEEEMSRASSKTRHPWEKRRIERGSTYSGKSEREGTRQRRPIEMRARARERERQREFHSKEERQRGRQRERDRERFIERDRERERQREKGTERERERDIHSKTKGNSKMRARRAPIERIRRRTIENLIVEKPKGER